MNAIIFDFDGVLHDTFELVYGISARTIGKELSREEYKNFFSGPLEEFYKRPPGGENLTDVKKRMLEFIKDIDGRYQNKNIAGNTLRQIEEMLAQTYNLDKKDQTRKNEWLGLQKKWRDLNEKLNQLK